jgi:hypothetical protein
MRQPKSVSAKKCCHARRFPLSFCRSCKWLIYLRFRVAGLGPEFGCLGSGLSDQAHETPGLIIKMNIGEHFAAAPSVVTGAITVVFLMASVATDCSNCQLFGGLCGLKRVMTLEKASKKALLYR